MDMPKSIYSIINYIKREENEFFLLCGMNLDIIGCCSFLVNKAKLFCDFLHQCFFTISYDYLQKQDSFI